MNTRAIKHVNQILLMRVAGVLWGTWFTMT